MVPDIARDGAFDAVVSTMVLCTVPDPVAALEEEYAGRGYGAFKADVADLVVELITPIRDRTLALLEDRPELDRLMARGAERAEAIAAQMSGPGETVELRASMGSGGDDQ